jgi:DNA-binding SARP family transcriptional activator
LSLAIHVALLISTKQTAKSYLQRALRLAEEIGTAQPLVAEFAHSLLLKKAFHQLFSESPLASQALNALQEAKRISSAQSNPINIVRKAQSLELLTLGQLKIISNAITIAPADWQAVSARELFLFLFFEGASTKDNVGLEFWPDLDAEKVRNNFHTSIRRAREALGENIIVHESGIYSINSDLEIWCDAYKFETFVTKARQLAASDARAENLLEKAVNLYKGDFLAQMHMAWITPYRLKLREVYVEALMSLAHCQQSHHDLKQAIQTLKRALEVDPYRETIHRQILVYYAEEGERQKVIAHYHELRRLLRTDLGIEPSPETVKLISTLL